MTDVPDRGDIMWIDFHPRVGQEQAGRRPALVLSPQAHNGKVGLAIFCPKLSVVLRAVPMVILSMFATGCTYGNPFDVSQLAGLFCVILFIASLLASFAAMEEGDPINGFFAVVFLSASLITLISLIFELDLHNFEKMVKNSLTMPSGENAEFLRQNSTPFLPGRIVDAKNDLAKLG